MKKYSDIRSSFVNSASDIATKSKDYVIDNAGTITTVGAVSVATGYASAGVSLLTGSAAAMKVAVACYYGGLAVATIGVTGLIAREFNKK